MWNLATYITWLVDCTGDGLEEYFCEIYYWWIASENYTYLIYHQNIQKLGSEIYEIGRDENTELTSKLTQQ